MNNATDNLKYFSMTSRNPGEAAGLFRFRLLQPPLPAVLPVQHAARLPTGAAEDHGAGQADRARSCHLVGGVPGLPVRPDRILLRVRSQDR